MDCSGTSSGDETRLDVSLSISMNLGVLGEGS